MPRSFAHWTPRYVTKRLQLSIHERLHPDDPWLTADAVRFLDDNLNRRMVGIECGSGRSTSWTASRIQHLLSLEHSPEWHRVVSSQLEAKKIANVTYHLLPSPSDYVDKLGQMPDSSADYMLVDGIERDLCFQEGTRIVRPGGLLLLDNANWYLPHNTFSPQSISAGAIRNEGQWPGLTASTRNWLCIWTSNGVTDTAIFVKPAA